MASQAPTSHDQNEAATNFEDLPHDELLRYGRSLGLDLEDKLTSQELAERVRQRHELLREIERDALLDVIIWSRRPVRKDAGKEELAREIARITRSNYDSLSRRGLQTLARLRGIPAGEFDSAEDIIENLRKQEGFWKWWHRKRRSMVAGWLARMIDSDTREEPGDYQFLPEHEVTVENGGVHSLKRQIEDYGVVGGIASRLRGAADDYIKVKLEEIESRIDEKLNQIDQRLAEWRDREVANRLKIIRITLVFTVLVAILSLGYNYLKKHAEEQQRGQAVEQVIDAE